MWSSTKIPNPDGMISTAWCSFSQQPKKCGVWCEQSEQSGVNKVVTVSIRSRILSQCFRG
jgi:hypothetical protein